MGYFEGSVRAEELIDTIMKNTLALCELRGISIAELAAEVKVSEAWFRRKHTDIGTTKLYAIASKFDVEPSQLWSSKFTAEIRLEALQAEQKRLQEEIEKITAEQTTPVKK